MDRYTKFILTMIAVALFGINYHMFGGEIISKAEAQQVSTIVYKVTLCDVWERNCYNLAGR